jgi:hypothetical protein
LCEEEESSAWWPIFAIEEIPGVKVIGCRGDEFLGWIESEDATEEWGRGGVITYKLQRE